MKMCIPIWLTLLFKVLNFSSSSAKHHGTAITCQVTCPKNRTETLNVTYVKKTEITGEATVKEGDTLNLTCTVDSFPQSIITCSKLGMNKSLTNETETSTLIIHNVTTEDSGQYFCKASHLNNLTQSINITVIILEILEINGEKTIEEGDTLNLTCRFDGFPRSLLIWTKLGFNTSIMNSTRTATLLIYNVTAEDSGQYMCTAQQQNTTLKEKVDVTVKYLKTPTITGESTIKQDGSLNLTCHVNSFPPSVIMWTKRGIKKTLNSKKGPGTSTLVIHNVTKEHSGQYFCSANHLNKTLEQDINITVIDEKKLKIIGETTLKEGDTLNLICTEDISPSSIIMWTKNGINKTLINETQSDNSSSTLVIYNMTAEDSGQYFCTAKHLNNTLTEKVDVLVTYVWKINITGEPTIREGDALNLTCTVESFHSPIIIWTKLGMNNTLNNETGTKGLTSTLIIPNVTTNDSGQYFCTAHHRTTQIQDINITIIYMRRPKIIGESVVTEGRDLNLTCSVKSWPLSLITWTKPGLNTALKDGSGAATLVIFNMTAENSGQYICTAKHLNVMITVEVHIRVTLLPKILEESGCEAQLEVLTCLCISQGFPSPTIRWEQLENYMENYVNTSVSNHTVISTISLNVKDYSSISAVCVSSNRNGKTSRNLNISRVEDEGAIMKLLRTITQMGTIIPFLIGVLLSTSISFLLLLCCRKKQKYYGSTSETLEMVMTQENDDYESIQVRGTTGGSNGPEAGTSDIEYSDINLVLLKQEIPSPSEVKPNKSDTEYAKIRPKGAKITKEGEGEGQGEEGVKLCVPEAAESEAAALYSKITKLHN